MADRIIDMRKLLKSNLEKEVATCVMMLVRADSVRVGIHPQLGPRREADWNVLLLWS